MHDGCRKPGLVLLLALAVVAVGCEGGTAENAPAEPVEPDARLFQGVWVPAAMQSSDAPPVANPLLGFRFTREQVEMVIVGGSPFRGASRYSRDADGRLVIDASDGTKSKRLVVEFTSGSDDAMRLTVDSSQVFVRRVPRLSVPDLPFADDSPAVPAANEPGD